MIEDLKAGLLSVRVIFLFLSLTSVTGNAESLAVVVVVESSLMEGEDVVAFQVVLGVWVLTHLTDVVIAKQDSSSSFSASVSQDWSLTKRLSFWDTDHLPRWH